jgi:hypothetical protein
MTLYEVNTEDKILRSCAENESIIRGERGDSEMAFDKIKGILELPASYKLHIETSVDTVLFNNPSLKKYAGFNSYQESSIDYNLQPRKVNIGPMKLKESNYPADLYKLLPLSLYNNIPIRELDENCK